MATEIADAYISLMVRMEGTKRTIETELGKADGKAAGEKLGDGIGGGISARSAAIAGAVGGIVASVANTAINALGGLVGEAIAASDATQKFAQTLDFAGLDTTAIDTAMTAARAYADGTVYDLSTIQNTTAALASNGIKDYSALTEAAGNLTAVAGGNAESFSSVAMALTQTSAAGKLTTENWNQLTGAVQGAAGPLMTALENAGAYTGNFREAMEKGEITAEEFNAAILELGNQPIAVEAAKSVATMEGATGNLAAAITGVLADAFTVIKPAITGFTSLLADFISNSQIFIPVITGIATALLVALAPAIGAATAATWTFTAALLMNPLTWIIVGIAALVAAIVALAMNWDTVVKWITDVWGGFIGWITGVIEGFVGWWNGIWTEFGNFISDVWNNIVTFVVGYINFILTTITNVMGFISTVWTNVWNGILNFLKGIWNGIIGFIEGGVNGAIDLINGLTGGLKDVAGFIGIEVGTIPHVSIPRLADGATILPRAGGTLAVLAERGRPETVVDTGLMNRALEQGLGGGATVIVNPGPGMDEETLGRVAADRLNAQMRSV